MPQEEMKTEPSYAHAIALCRKIQGCCLFRASERVAQPWKTHVPHLSLGETTKPAELLTESLFSHPKLYNGASLLSLRQMLVIGQDDLS